MLNRIRRAIEPTLNAIGSHAAKTGLPASFWTGIGLLLSLFSGVAYGNPIFGGERIAGILLLASGVMDVMDGSVARVTATTSRGGAFLDSALDRMAEVFVFAGIVYGNIIDPVLALLALSFSLLVSYARAKAESLGVSVSGVGIGERAERIFVLSVLSIGGYTSYGVIAVLFIATFTFIQRFRYIIGNLRQ